MILWNALKNQKKLQNNHFDTNFKRKLASPNKIIIQYNSNFSCAILTSFFKQKSFVSSYKVFDGNSESSMDGVFNCFTNYKYFLYFSDDVNSLFDILNGDQHEEFQNVIATLDLTEFNISKITNFQEAFRHLNTLKEIKFPTDKKVKPTNVRQMFKTCSSLTSVDLSMFDLSECDYTEMINGCTALKSIIVHDFNFKNEDLVRTIFLGGLNLTYVDIYNAKGDTGTIKNSIATTEFLQVCQSEFIIPQKLEICCDGVCKENFIEIYYKEACIYESGFKANSDYRQIDFMLKHNDNIFNGTTQFSISKGDKLKIYFAQSPTNLEYFLSGDIDTNMKYVYSIDFTNFDSSNVISLSNLFKGCSSLEFINFTNFKTSSVSNMASMIEGCESIKILNISGFNMESVTNLGNMFQGLTKLNYIILQDFTTSESFKQEISKVNGLDKLNKRLLVCQDKENKILTNEKYKTHCCNFDIEKHMCISNNYLVVNYQESTEYNSNFLNDYRNDIVFINNEQGTIFLAENDLTFEGIIKLELDPDTISLKNLFNYEIDNNVEKIISIDFSHLNTSLIKDMDSTFKGCKSLKSFNFSKIQTSSLISMDSTFAGCENLESLDLSYFTTSSVTNMNSFLSNCKKLKEIDLSNFETPNVVNMDYMFAGCENLQYIDISLFNMIKIQSAIDMFNGIKNIKYINLENVHYSKNYISGSPLNDLDDLLYSQKEIILEGNNNKGCYYNITSYECESSNYIIIYYAEDTEYKKGFGNKFRENIDFIIAEDRNKKIAPSESFSIVRGNKIEIYYKDTTKIKSLQSYFDSNEDENAKNIKYIDITHLNIYLEDTSLSSLFKGCNLLESVYLSNLNTSNVTNMDSMFADCNSLKLIDLSNFVTSKVTNMNSMFSGCSSLEYIDIYPFDMEQVNTAESMFENVENLKYINLYHVNDPNGKIKGSYLNGKTSSIFCQEKKILDFDNINIKCCYYDMKNKNCEIGNYMTIYYGNDTEYLKGFANQYRTDIKYIIGYNREVEIMANQSFKITGGNKIEVYFSSNLKSLQNFFYYKNDNNVKNIISIDLSQLNSFEIERLDFSFYGCSSLKSIDLTYFNTTSLTKTISTFKDCSSLESIDLSYLNTTLVTDMNNMFSGCSSLESIDLSYLNTTKVISMKSMFSECTSLKYLDLSYLDFSSCTDISAMLSKCSSLKVLDISYLDLKKVKKYSAMFMHVDLRYINLYDTKNFPKDEYIIKMNNLTVCQSENILNNSNYQYKCCYFNITSNECEIDKFIKIYYGEDAIYTNGFGLVEKTNNNENEINQFRKDRDSYFIIYKNFKTELKSDDAFSINKGTHLEIYFLTEVIDMSNYFNAEIDNNLKKIKKVEFRNFNFPLNNMKSMFYGCSSLKSINITNIDTSLVTDMSQIFFGCSSLESIDLSDFNTSSLINMSSMFNGCNSLKFLDISSFNTSLVLDMSKLFYECNELTSIDLFNFNTNKLENMNSMFYNCISLEIISLSNFVLDSINDLNNLFEGCTSLKYLDISSFNLGKINSINSLFKDNKNLEYLNLYNVHDSNGVIAQNGISDWKSLKVCQKEIIMTSFDDTIINNECCYYNITSQMCENNNFMMVYFGEDVEYEKGFIYDNNGKIFRNGVDYIINGNYEKKLNGNERLIIKAGIKLEIYFSNPLDTLENFFSSTYDANSDKIISIDFSHFNSSCLINMKNIFYNCGSLKNIDFTKFNTYLVSDMSSMFEGCASLEMLDLSYFDTSSVTNMDSMFSGCSSLQLLDISNFNLEKISKLNSMFKGLVNLNYINLYNVKNADIKFEENELYNINDLIVCQKTYAKIIKSDKIIEKCCYYNFSESEDKCFYTNYIIIYYGIQAEYKNGFIKDGRGEEFRSGIEFMISRSHNLKRSNSDKLIIPPGIKLEIYFSTPLTSLENYFNSDFDVNANKIVSIDFSHFDAKDVQNMESMLSGCISLESVNFDNFNTSKVVNMKKMFYGCNKIESIDLSFFITPLVTDMSSMFEGCTSLKMLDLSYFDTSSVTNMDSMLSGCSSLQLLDISHFNLEKISKLNSMFKGLDNLKYLNLFYIQNFNDKLKESELNNIANLIVCQKQNLIANDNIINKCCYFDLVNNEECIYTNYMVIFFGKEVEYNSGFVGDNIFRKNIDFIINGEDHNLKLKGTDKLNLHKGSKIELYFSNSNHMTSTQSFFNSLIDTNTERIELIDLYLFNTSLVTDMSSMLKGCQSLKSIDLTYFNTSLVTDMSSMFEGCASLELLDFTIF